MPASQKPHKHRTRSLAALGLLATVFALVACSLSGRPGAPAVSAQGAPRAGDAFVNLQPFPPSASFRDRAGLWLRKIGTTLWPRGGAADRAVFDANAAEYNPSITWIGHATFLVRMDGVTFLTDPMFSDWAAPFAYTGPKRAVPPGLALEQLPKIDFALISHDHYDHADLPSMRWLAAHGVRFVVPLGVGEVVRAAGGQAIELDWWQHVDLGAVRVHCVPAQHHSGRGLGDAGRRLWSGMVVRGATRSFYHAGDTGYTNALAEIGQRLGPIDLAAVPIGGYETPSPGPFLHATPEQAAKLALDLRARRVVGMHFGTFDLADEPMDEPPRRFRAAARAGGLDDEHAWVLKVGETRSW